MSRRRARKSRSTDLSAGEVVALALVEAATDLTDHAAALRDPRHVDAETIHQARVATRRLRSNLGTYRPVLDATWADAVRRPLSELAAVLGAVRDADVLLDRLSKRIDGLDHEFHASGAVLVAALAEERQNALAVLSDMADTGRLDSILVEVSDAACAPEFSTEADELASQVINRAAGRAWKRLRNQAERLIGADLDTVPLVALHRLRIRAKRFRYAAEAAGATESAATRHARSVRRLQEELGLLNDAATTQRWLVAHTGHVPTATAFVAGQLYEREAAEIVRRRHTWVPTWRRASGSGRADWLP